MSRRIQKINELLKEEISNIILRELDVSREIIITVTKVETFSDLSQAKAWISIMPFLKAEKILRVLNSQVFNIQKLLNKKLKIKVIPKITFELDISEEKVGRVEQLLKRK